MFFPLRQKVFKQMLLQKKKNVAALRATALLTPHFHKKQKRETERERMLQAPVQFTGEPWCLAQDSGSATTERTPRMGGF